jgi:hypothetical protein
VATPARLRRNAICRVRPGMAILSQPLTQDSGEPLHYSRLLRHVAGLCMRRPRLIAPLVRAGWRCRRRDWYRRAPFMPLPPREYLAWRLDTAYGAADALPPRHELARYLRWVVAQDR